MVNSASSSASNVISAVTTVVNAVVPDSKLIQIDIDGQLRVFDGFLLDAERLSELADCDELILDSLKRGQHGLPIIGDALPVSGACGVDLRCGKSAVE